MMLTYIYDGSLEGLLTVLALTLDQTEPIHAISSCHVFQPNLFTEDREVVTDQSLASGFFERLQAGLSPALVGDLLNCLLSEIPGVEMVLLDFIRLLVKDGETATRNYANQSVFTIRRVSDQVNHEVQRLQGFVRFRQLAGGLYYAAIEPDHNIVSLLAPHFTARFADQTWLIHDLKRRTGIFYESRSCRFLPEVTIDPEVTAASRPFTPNRVADGFAAGEFAYQSIWNQYFQAIAIPERTNLRTQKQRMPKRYWKHLVERVASEKP
jgi:probable DNA metabolism protein